MQDADVPGGLPRVIDRLRGKLLFAREVTVDSALFQAGGFHQIIEGAAFVAALVEDGGGCLHNLSPGLFTFGHRVAPSETDRSFLILALRLLRCSSRPNGLRSGPKYLRPLGLVGNLTRQKDRPMRD